MHYPIDHLVEGTIAPNGNQIITAVFGSLFGQFDGVFFSQCLKKLYTAEVDVLAIPFKPRKFF